MKQVRRVLGIDFTRDEAVKILRGLEFDVKEIDADALQVTVPPHRRDFDTPDGQADLVEELARIHGYDHMPATLLADRLPEQHTNASLVFEERLRDLLVSAGLQETVTYALTTPERDAAFVPGGEHIRLLNPISSERVVMRKSLLPGVLEAAASNLRHTDDVRLFEIGSVYLPASPPGREKGNDKLPAEPCRLALALSGKRSTEFWADFGSKSAALDFFDLKGVVAALAEDLHLPETQYRSSTAAYLHPGMAATLLVKGKPVGDFGKLHPRLARELELEGRSVLVGEFDVDALRQALPERYTYTPVPRFPAALRDIAVVVPEAVSAEQLEKEIRGGGGQLLAGVTLFDVYRGDSIPAGTKSLAYALSYQAEDRTLTDKEVDKAHQKIEERLKRTLKAQIRGKDLA
jgi:phenylalanyl-tRNA synthetase beta chain